MLGEALDPLRVRLPWLRRGAGARILFDGLVLLSRVSGGRIDADDGRAESQTRGAEGAYQYDVPGAGGGTWHVLVTPGRMRWRPGPHPAPRSVVTLDKDELFAVLTGARSFLTMSMSGKIRVRGDAHATMMFGALVGRLRAMRDEPGGRGRFVRGWLDLAARRSGTPHRFPSGHPSAHGGAA